MACAERTVRHAAWRRLLETHAPHELVVTVLTEPGGTRCMELRRMLDGRPLLARIPYSVVLLGECLAEGCEVGYRSVLRLPREEAP